MTGKAGNRAVELDRRLRAGLTITKLEIEDQSHLHAGHAGAKEGQSHFHIVICAEEFGDQSYIQRHKLVYTAVGNLMETDIHALSIEAIAPE